MNCSHFLHQPDIVIDPMVANSDRAASSVKAAAAEGGGRRPAFTELAARPNSGRRIRRLIDTLVIALIPENASRTECELAHGGSPLDASPPPQSGVLDGEIKQLQRRFVVWKAAAGLDDLAQATVQRLDRVGGVDHFADAGGEGEERNHVLPGAASSLADRRVALAPFGLELLEPASAMSAFSAR